VLASNELSPSLVAVAGSRVVWVAVGQQAPGPAADGGPAALDASTAAPVAVRAVSASGGAAVDLALETSHVAGILGLVASDDGSKVYYSIDDAVKVVPAAGGPTTTVVHDQVAFPSALALEGSKLAFTETSGKTVDAVTLVDGVVVTCGPSAAEGADASTGAAGCSEISDNTQAVAQVVVVRKGLVYYADSATIVRTSATSADARASNQRIAEGDGQVTGLAAGPSELFFTAPPVGAIGASVEMVPYATSSTALGVATAQHPTGALAVDGARVYWADVDCSIEAVTY
jgi:hypothetical protein